MHIILKMPPKQHFIFFPTILATALGASPSLIDHNLEHQAVLLLHKLLKLFQPHAIEQHVLAQLHILLH
jgi:hypothetical protein